jgi:hypothetical protein
MNYTITKTVVTPGGTIQGAVTKTAELNQEIEVTLTSEQANKEITLSLVRAKIVALVITCTTAATVKINSSGNAASITLAAGVPFVFAGLADELAMATVFAADITALFVTNLAATAGTIQICALSDPTP